MLISVNFIIINIFSLLSSTGKQFTVHCNDMRTFQLYDNEKYDNCEITNKLRLLYHKVMSA